MAGGVEAMGGDKTVRMWAILRTSPGRTVSLAQSLKEDGIEAWTPIEVRTRRLRRSQQERTREVPILPTYVFVRAEHLPVLSRFARSEESPHPPFSVFRYLHRVPLLADSDIQAFRDEERRVAPKPKARHFDRGASVHIPEDGPYRGLSGVVESQSSRGFFWVEFFGGRRIKVASWLLAADAVSDGHSDVDAAA